MAKKAIISSTNDPLYDFFIPIAVWSWDKIDIDTVVFIPETRNERMLLIKSVCSPNVTSFYTFKAAQYKLPTYSQTVRLFAGCLKFDQNDILILSDADMAVFDRNYFHTIDGDIHVLGSDLTPEGQLPVCYTSMSVKKWNEVMECDGKTYQEMLDLHLGEIECENFRGNYWCFEQGLLYNAVSKHPFVSHPRAYPGTQFATRREDRDSWGNVSRVNLLDSHLPRPGYTEENFAKILGLFQEMYPEENFDWMIKYRNEYLKLL